MSLDPDPTRIALGAVATARPAAVARLGSASPTVDLLVRLLGVRYLAQGAVGLLSRSPRVRTLSAAVEGLHAASLAWAWWRFPAQRPLLLAGGTAAVVLTVGDLRELGGRRRGPAGGDVA